MITRLTRKTRSEPICWQADQRTREFSLGEETLGAHERPTASWGRTVLVPVDFTESSCQASHYAVHLARRLDACVVLLHVVDQTRTGNLFRSVVGRTRYYAEQCRARRILEAIAMLHAKSRVPIKCLVRDGVPEYEILRLAETLDVELIVLGRSPRGLLKRLLFGSMTDDVVQCSCCPVVVVAARKSPVVAEGTVLGPQEAMRRDSAVEWDRVAGTAARSVGQASAVHWTRRGLAPNAPTFDCRSKNIKAKTARGG